MNSSRNPNLENIPRSSGFSWQYTYPIKGAFVAPDGYVITVHDYSQLELRIMAHQCGDPDMISAYADENSIDLHEMTRLALAERSGDKDFPRTIAKNVNFGLLYGQTPQGLRDFLWLKARVNRTVEECIEWHEAFFQRYPGIKDYHDQIFEEVRDNGFVRTLVGRTRQLGYLFGLDKGSAFRIGVNFTIQGTAADIIKLAMRNIRRRVRSEKEWAGADFHFVDQVHDELVCECREECADAICSMIGYEMEHALPLRVPLKADGAWAKDWKVAKEKAG